METKPPEDALTCAQCGGELHPDEGQIFLTCPFCSSTVYIDKRRVVFHWYLAPTLDEAKARGGAVALDGRQPDGQGPGSKGQRNRARLPVFPDVVFQDSGRQTAVKKKP